MVEKSSSNIWELWKKSNHQCILLCYNMGRSHHQSRPATDWFFSFVVMLWQKINLLLTFFFLLWLCVETKINIWLILDILFFFASFGQNFLILHDSIVSTENTDLSKTICFSLFIFMKFFITNNWSNLLSNYVSG
jgi:hypothetical protein